MNTFLVRGIMFFAAGMAAGAIAFSGLPGTGRIILCLIIGGIGGAILASMEDCER